MAENKKTDAHRIYQKFCVNCEMKWLFHVFFLNQKLLNKININSNELHLREFWKIQNTKLSL